MAKISPEKKAALTNLAKRKHQIDSADAKQMIGDFAALKAELAAVKKYAPLFNDADPLFPKSIAINKAALMASLAQPNCIGLRFYPALSKENKFTLVVVGIDKAGENMMPAPQADVAVGEAVAKTKRLSASVADGGGGAVLDEGQNCPPFAPPNNDF